MSLLQTDVWLLIPARPPDAGMKELSIEEPEPRPPVKEPPGGNPPETDPPSKEPPRQDPPPNEPPAPDPVEVPVQEPE